MGDSDDQPLDAEVVPDFELDMVADAPEVVDAVLVRVTDDWAPDRLLDGFESTVIDLHDQRTVAGEVKESLTATLVRRGEPVHDRAVLYVHGWNDYFFQSHLAEFFESCGIDFYAIDLRRYGRNLAKGIIPGYMTSITDYYVELDAAYELIAEGHDSISVMGHSTGGLTASLWANDRPGWFEAVMLNSPWLELQESSWLRQVTKPVLAALSAGNPIYALPISDSGFFQRSLHSSLDGEWDYDRNLKGHPAFKPRVGWFNAVLAGHARIADGISIDAPVIVMTSARSDFRRAWHDDFKKADIVLAVEQIAMRVVQLGDNVTLVRVDDAMHDLVLSPEPVRTEVFAQLRRWMTGYLPT